MMTERKYATDGLRTGNWMKSGIRIESQVSKKISGFKENKRTIFPQFPGNTEISDCS